MSVESPVSQQVDQLNNVIANFYALLFRQMMVGQTGSVFGPYGTGVVELVTQQRLSVQSRAQFVNSIERTKITRLDLATDKRPLRAWEFHGLREQPSNPDALNMSFVTAAGLTDLTVGKTNVSADLIRYDPTSTSSVRLVLGGDREREAVCAITCAPNLYQQDFRIRAVIIAAVNRGLRRTQLTPTFTHGHPVRVADLRQARKITPANMLKPVFVSWQNTDLAISYQSAMIVFPNGRIPLQVFATAFQQDLNLLQYHPT